MQIRILRAADEVGGNCIEVQANGKSILLDLGMPLSGEPLTHALLPAVHGLGHEENPDLLGIVLSHPHQDHYGLLAVANPDVPVYLGEAAARLLHAAAPFTPGAVIPQPTTMYASGVPFDIPPFRITPILVDHSAFDAHALLVEANGKRLLYSGDFRLHGRKGQMMERFLHHPPKDIDVLLMEGTTVGRPDTHAETEDALEHRISDALKACNGLALAYTAGQNIDRLVTFYRAARRAGRGLILDVYTAELLRALRRETLPSADSPGARVFLPQSQKLRLVRSGQTGLATPYKNRRIYPAQMRNAPGRWVMLFRDSMRPDIEGIGELDGGLLAYSMWPGYLRRRVVQPVDVWATQNGMRFEILHTSGHASAEDLSRFAHSMAPRRLIPIHTVHPDRFRSIYPEVQVVENGRWVLA